MAHCPSCQSELVDDFGLVECAQCGAPLIMHVDGSVEAASPIASSTNEADGNDEIPNDTPAVEDIFAAESEAPPDIFAESEAQSDEPDPFAEAQDEPAEEDAEDEAHAPGDKPDIFAVTNPGFEPANESAAPSSADLSDIARFGNSDQTSSRDGMLRYNILIAGIDTVDVRELFREIIMDRKFMWDSDSILRAIVDGEVRIENLVASKAFVLVSRLRALPVGVRWEQYAVHSN